MLVTRRLTTPIVGTGTGPSIYGFGSFRPRYIDGMDVSYTDTVFDHEAGLVTATFTAEEAVLELMVLEDDVTEEVIPDVSGMGGPN